LQFADVMPVILFFIIILIVIIGVAMGCTCTQAGG